MLYFLQELVLIHIQVSILSKIPGQIKIYNMNVERVVLAGQVVSIFEMS